MKLDKISKSLSVGNKVECYGCGVCAAICKSQALEIFRNPEGFLVPRLNSERCTDCGLCTKICAFDTISRAEYSHPLESYAGWSEDRDIRIECSSGGIGYEIGRLLFKMDYKPCGAIYESSENEVTHKVFKDLDGFKHTIGSKYLQSKTEKAFSQINIKDKNVIFGTPCQIDMWRRYLKLMNKEENFILVDFFCHGVPSYNLWKKYLKENNIDTNKISKVTWRDKLNGWHNSWNVSIFFNKEESAKFRARAKDGDTFYFTFLSNIALNPACYSSCKYKGVNSSADIRIGDMWGKEYRNNEEGVSTVYVFSGRGKEVVEMLRISSCTFVPFNLDIVAEGQMKINPDKPREYKLISRLIRSKSISLRMIRRAYVLKEIIEYQFRKLRG